MKTRRDFLRLAATGAVGATLASSRALAAAPAHGNPDRRPSGKRLLILGGTGFIGPHFVDALTAGGHRISLFNRGKREHEEKPGVEQLLGDRDNDLKSLEGRDWDVVIDNSGYTPVQVELSTSLLKHRVKYYIFISSIAR